MRRAKKVRISSLSELFELKLILLLGIVIIPFAVEAQIMSSGTNSLPFAAYSLLGRTDTNNSQTLPLLTVPSTGAGPLARSTTTQELAIANGVALLPTQVIDNGSMSSPTSDTISTYIVHKGDSIDDIAKMFNVSVNTIRWSNNLKKNSPLTEGEKLTILPISGIEHVVVTGDSVDSIARTYKGDPAEILSYNGLSDPTALKIGQSILIPNGELTTLTARPALATLKKKPSLSELTLTTNSKKTPSLDTTPTLSNSILADGYYIRPIVGGIRSQGLHGNNAVDLADHEGTPILASAAGEVVISADNGKWNGGYGNYIVLQHNNGSQTLYAHTSSNAVSVGQKVTQGQVIGYVGQTGLATGPHVHFEIRNGPINPF
jgi:LysM repeat protein